MLFDTDLYEKVDKISKDFGLTKSAFIRMAIIEYINDLESRSYDKTRIS